MVSVSTHPPSRKRHAQDYTPDEDALLRKLIPTRLPVHEIAERLGRTWASVRNRAEVLGLRRPPPLTRSLAPETIEKVRRRLMAGRPAEEIADELAAELPPLSQLEQFILRVRRTVLGLAGRTPTARGKRLSERTRAASAALAARYGLPEHLNAKQVGVVVALASGPKTVADLAAALQTRPERLYGNDDKKGKTSALSALRRDGLIVSVRRRDALGRETPALYMLTSHAIDLLAAAAGKEVAS